DDEHCAIPGDHGANLDSKVLTAGASVYLPVAVEGAGLALGDLHACMGDGELSGTGIEAAGKALITTSVIKGAPVSRPLVETADSIYLLASAADIHAAIRTAVEDLTRLLMRKKALNFPDAYRLLSATCDIQISQLVNEKFTVRARAPKAVLGIASALG
ncbi:MAG: acetamidase/formamidase family protein, partial [Deltaproteobacteria bacterium]|nr:acetamidase/formamidase family protein [Deltaproteobacteria bacterium]